MLDFWSTVSKKKKKINTIQVGLSSKRSATKNDNGNIQRLYQKDLKQFRFNSSLFLHMVPEILFYSNLVFGCFMMALLEAECLEFCRGYMLCWLFI
jgi:hypothetical protein